MKHRVAKPLDRSFSPYDRSNRESRRRGRPRSPQARRVKRLTVNLCSGHLRRQAVLWAVTRGSR